MEVSLTKNSEDLISLLYKIYSSKRQAGSLNITAKYFGGSVDIQQKILPEWSLADIDNTCRDLECTGLLNNFYADGFAYGVHLSDKGISYMEKRGI